MILGIDPKLCQAKSSRKLILMSGHAEGLMLSLNVWLLKCGATERFTCVAFKSTPQYSWYCVGMPSTLITVMDLREPHPPGLYSPVRGSEQIRRSNRAEAA
jgi:hypothetical protein